VRQAARIPPCSAIEAVAADPVDSYTRRVIAFAGGITDPEARGLPAGFAAVSTTSAGSTEIKLSVGGSAPSVAVT
jgi:hypothetical protein